MNSLPTLPLDAAFAGNRLLASLSAAERELLAEHMTVISLEPGERVLTAGGLVDRSLFPFDGLMVSMITELSGGRSVEVASIGKEGAVGGMVSSGVAPAFTNAVVQIGGRAASIPMAVLQSAKQASPHLQELFCRYGDALLAQVMQSVACNSFHPIEARAARWLLHAQDRVGGDRLALTQESLASLLGVQRTTVNAVARVLGEQGLIANRRGAIQVVDRDGLEAAACECYARVEGHFGAILGPDGRGRTTPSTD
ncbi:Crp/Fnr family transcriptional regulator [Sphingomonas sp. BN140010]|uniref:Crp/Fnr family transcriptional regulator n=1 Tax=Sphingomonas arvum TaxID=2992113 RepID=A0ABT3JG86_9SPHN|nr:Crp/Fnr family transcriptional regulator [Sphingomonas sp. BN140010]MCW3798058.1 Crp/Fnr family transcriptional regulator [Sphingomonas sp. BN140010]